MIQSKINRVNKLKCIDTFQIESNRYNLVKLLQLLKFNHAMSYQSDMLYCYSVKEIKAHIKPFYSPWSV